MPFRKTPRPREPRPVGEIIEQVSGESGWTERLAAGRLREHWTEVAGPAVAKRSEPVRLENGVLTIRAESGTWATELTLLSSQLALKAERFLGPGTVTECRVLAGGTTPRGDAK